MEKFVSVEEIIYRLKALTPGERVTYYIGDLCKMHARTGSHLTARLAWDLHEEGRVHLLQRRLSPPRNHLGAVDWHSGHGSGFEYIAIGKSRKSKAPNFNSHLRSVMEAV